MLSGGNFHAEPVAFAADMLALACAEIGSITERRVALLVDPKMSGLPAFLAPDSGVNSGFMMAQVTAAALVAENRMLCHPASVDSIPTSANQEDHVSMATHGARRLLTMTANALQHRRDRVPRRLPGHRPARPAEDLARACSGAYDALRAERCPSRTATGCSPSTSRRPRWRVRREDVQSLASSLVTQLPLSQHPRARSDSLRSHACARPTVAADC